MQNSVDVVLAASVAALSFGRVFPANWKFGKTQNFDFFLLFDTDETHGFIQIEFDALGRSLQDKVVRKPKTFHDST